MDCHWNVVVVRLFRVKINRIVRAQSKHIEVKKYKTQNLFVRSRLYTRNNNNWYTCPVYFPNTKRFFSQVFVSSDVNMTINMSVAAHSVSIYGFDVYSIVVQSTSTGDSIIMDNIDSM